MKTKYVYRNPLDNGYKKFKLSKKQHNEIFKRRKIKWIDRYEYYYDDKQILLHKFYNPLVVGLSTLLFPNTVLFQGIANIKECWKDLKSLYNQKKTGSFIGDSISYKTETYDKVMDIIKLKL